MVDTIRHAFSVNRLPDGGVIYGMNESRTSDAEFLVYPNPADQQVTLRSRATPDESFIAEILNLQGAPVSRVTSTPAAGYQEVRISTASLPSGLYLLKVSSGSEIVIQKLVVSH